MKYPLIALGVLAVIYASWAIGFKLTGLSEKETGGELEAYFTAAHVADEVGAKVMRTSGVSNSTWGINKEGYFVLREVSFEELQKNQFVIYHNWEGDLINHRLRIETPEGWMVEGDASQPTDRDLVTADNLIGIVHNNTVYRY